MQAIRVAISNEDVQDEGRGAHELVAISLGSPGSSPACIVGPRWSVASPVVGAIGHQIVKDEGWGGAHDIWGSQQIQVPDEDLLYAIPTKPIAPVNRARINPITKLLS